MADIHQVYEVYESLNSDLLFQKIATNEEDYEQSWEDKNVFCYPADTDNPYKWVSKAYRNNSLVAIVLPIIKDSTWYKKFISNNVHMELRTLKKKITFNKTKYDAMVVIFYPE